MIHQIYIFTLICTTSLTLCPVPSVPQHYLKVHAPRTLHCPKCQTAAFASEALMRAHWRLCGADYRCGCGAQYSNLRTLRAHAAKHGHSTVLKLR